MVSTNYSPCFQPLPSQEVRMVPYKEPPFVPTVGKLFLTCNQYTAQNEDGTYTVSVKLLRDKDCITIEHVSNGDLFMRIQIVSEKLLDFQSRNEYFLLSNKYHELFLDHYRRLNEKRKAEWKIRKAEQKREFAERRLELQRIHERAMNHPLILIHDFVAIHATNIAVTTKNFTQNALILTRDTSVKTASVAKESISKVVFFCSAAWVYINSSQDAGNNGKMQPVIDMRKLIVKKIAQNSSYAPSLIAQLLYNEKKD